MESYSLTVQFPNIEHRHRKPKHCFIGRVRCSIPCSPVFLHFLCMFEKYCLARLCGSIVTFDSKSVGSRTAEMESTFQLKGGDTHHGIHFDRSDPRLRPFSGQFQGPPALFLRTALLQFRTHCRAAHARCRCHVLAVIDRVSWWWWPRRLRWWRWRFAIYGPAMFMRTGTDGGTDGRGGVGGRRWQAEGEGRRRRGRALSPKLLGNPVGRQSAVQSRTSPLASRRTRAPFGRSPRAFASFFEEYSLSATPSASAFILTPLVTSPSISWSSGSHFLFFMLSSYTFSASTILRFRSPGRLHFPRITSSQFPNMGSFILSVAEFVSLFICLC